MRIVDDSTWVQAVQAGVAVLHARHTVHGRFDSHDLVNWLNDRHNAVLNEIIDNYRITKQGKRAKNPVHTATREIGKFIERELGQVKIDDHLSVRKPIKLAGGGVHPAAECTNSVWNINAATTSSAQQLVQPAGGATGLDFDDLDDSDLD